MGIKVTGTLTALATINFPFTWRDAVHRVFIRRADYHDVCLTTGNTSKSVASDIEAWSMRLSQVTLTSD